MFTIIFYCVLLLEPHCSFFAYKKSLFQVILCPYSLSLPHSPSQPVEALTQFQTCKWMCLSLTSFSAITDPATLPLHCSPNSAPSEHRVIKKSFVYRNWTAAKTLGSHKHKLHSKSFMCAMGIYQTTEKWAAENEWKNLRTMYVT